MIVTFVRVYTTCGRAYYAIVNNREQKNTSCSTPVLKHYCVNEFEIMQNYSIMLAGGVAQFHHSPWLRSLLNSQEFLQHFD